MAIALNPVFPVVTSKPVAADAVLQPGTVITAQVLKVLESNFVRIAIANLTIDVLSEVPLQAGQTLQLAVSQNPHGIKLAVVPPGSNAASALDDVSVTQGVNAAKPIAAAANTPALTDLQALAVSSAVQTAASRQTGLSQLFVNLAAATGTDVLPPQVKQAVAQLFALQPQLTENLTGAKIQAAFEASGLFREKTLSSLPSGQPQPAALPDLKSALIVLRQTLSVALATEAGRASPLPQGNAGQTQPVVPATAPSAVALAPTLAAAAQTSATSASQPVQAPVIAAPPLAPAADEQVILIPQARLPLTVESPEAVKAANLLANIARPGAAPIAADTFLSLIQNALQIARAGAGADPGKALTQPSSDLDPGIARTTVPPPPFRGAAPSAQAVAVATLAPDAPAAAIVHHLIEDADGAIARQTLLQIASLPDRADLPGAKLDHTIPRWSFEIPFVTPLGTAVAQFEVARDGSGSGEIGAGSKIWRARFSLDVEPAGPVHAIISLAGETTSVRMWAERPFTAAQLRAGSAELAHALCLAELQPGDIVIGEGEPPQAATVPAGHFVNLAS